MESFAPNLQKLAAQLPPFIIAVVFHEYAHGLMANRWGDQTAKDAGRLTLNPVPHLDPIGTLLIPIINMVSGIPLLIGWARPVPIDPSQFRSHRHGLFWVSIAGPGMNVLLAVLASAVLLATAVWVPEDFYLYDPLMEMLKVAIPLNYALAIFNMIPLPPLDGSKVIQSVLSREAAMKYETLSRYSFFIVMALLLTGSLSVLAYPIQYMSQSTISLMALLIH